MTIKLFLGFDPGGVGGSSGCKPGCRGHFGWSVFYEGYHGIVGRLDNGLSTNAWSAVDHVNGIIESYNNPCVRATGIDAPLRVHRKKGNRNIDQNLRDVLTRKKFPGAVGGTVMAVNRLQGAATVQGGLLVMHLVKKAWAQNMMITESHPKAFRHLLSCVNQPQVEEIANSLTADLPPQDEKDCQSGHELDATLCAIAAWAASPPLPNWYDLYEQEYELREDGTKGDVLIPLFQIPESTQLRYWMPMPR